MHLRVGQDVLLRVLEGSARGEYVSSVLAITPQQLRLSLPEGEEGDLPVLPGQRVQWDAVLDTRVLRWEACVAGRETGVAGLVVPLPASPRRVQRRQDVRHHCSLPVAIRFQDVLQRLARPVFGHTSDISAGGVRLRAEAALQAGDRLILRIDLPRQGTVTALGEVVRVQEERAPQGLPQPVAGVRFTDITSADQSAIVRFIFAEQLELRRRGLL